MAFACMVDREIMDAEGGQETLDAGDNLPGRAYVVALMLEVSIWRADWEGVRAI